MFTSTVIGIMREEKGKINKIIDVMLLMFGIALDVALLPLEIMMYLSIKIIEEIMKER